MEFRTDSVFLSEFRRSNKVSRIFLCSFCPQATRALLTRQPFHSNYKGLLHKCDKTMSKQGAKLFSPQQLEMMMFFEGGECFVKSIFLKVIKRSLWKYWAGPQVKTVEITVVLHTTKGCLVGEKKNQKNPIGEEETSFSVLSFPDICLSTWENKQN